MPPTTKTEKEEENKETESDINVKEANETDTDPINETNAYKTDLITSTVATDLATPRLLLDDGWVMGASVVATEREEGHMTWKANTSMASHTRIDDERYGLLYISLPFCMSLLHLHTSFLTKE